MKPVIEEPFRNLQQSVTFAELINTIIESRNEQELRDKMFDLSKRHFSFDKTFDFGFGHNHMWVNEHRRSRRLLIVQF